MEDYAATATRLRKERIDKERRAADQKATDEFNKKTAADKMQEFARQQVDALYQSLSQLDGFPIGTKDEKLAAHQLDGSCWLSNGAKPLYQIDFRVDNFHIWDLLVKSPLSKQDEKPQWKLVGKAPTVHAAMAEIVVLVSKL